MSVGPFWNIGPQSDRSDSQDSDSDGTDIFLAYQEQGAERVKLGKVVPNATGERGQRQQDDPQLIIDGGTDPAIDVTPGGQVKVAAEQQGEIAFVGCADDDDKCKPSKIVSNPTTEPPVGIEGEGSRGSCTDNLDNDGDGKTDLADIDCKWSSEQESSQRGLCSDGQDNDNDGVIDSDDEDCFHPSKTAGAVDTVTLQAQKTTLRLQAQKTTIPQASNLPRSICSQVLLLFSTADLCFDWRRRCSSCI